MDYFAIQQSSSDQLSSLYVAVKQIFACYVTLIISLFPVLGFR